MRERMDRVIDWGTGHGHSQDNPAGRQFPKSCLHQENEGTPPGSALWRDVPAVLRRVGISTCFPLTKVAFQLLVPTGTRSGEVRDVEWGEIDWDSAT